VIPHIRLRPTHHDPTNKGVHVKHTRSAVLATTSLLAMSLAACGGGGESGGSSDAGGFTPRGDVTMIVPFGAGGGGRGLLGLPG
jgi:putative tricarboxylic transport membrane protein